MGKSIIMSERQSEAVPSNNMQHPPILVYCLAIDTLDKSLSDKHYLSMTNEQKKKDSDAEKPLEVGFEKLSYTNNDFDSDVDDD